ncbi:major facilitator superfamily domain-containing protein [Gorgonomyces haynaldii]|nr:major facilitator superfamily domain-containing protein [Gorgonomyces haynaldii]
MDSGWDAWLQVWICFVIQFVVLGTMNSFGVYQEYYESIKLFDSQLQISFIGSLTCFGEVFFGVLGGRLADLYGYRLVTMVGGLVFLASPVLASFCTEYWQFLIFQGLLMGLGCCFCLIPCLAIISHWFDKRKGLAMGISVSGAGFGGIVISPLLEHLNAQLGYQWSLRIIGISGGTLVLISAYFMKQRLPSKKGQPMDWQLYLKDSRFLRLLFSGIFSSFGFFIPFFFISVFAVDHQMTSAEGALLVGLMNCAGGFGRFGLSMLGDHYGHVNMLAFSLFLASVSTLLIWNLTSSFAGLIVYCLLYGLGIGGSVSLLSTSVSSIYGTDNVGSLTGLVWLGASVGNLLGPPTAAILLEQYPHYYLPVILLTGLCLLVASLIIFSTVFKMNNRLLF